MHYEPVCPAKTSTKGRLEVLLLYMWCVRLNQEFRTSLLPLLPLRQSEQFFGHFNAMSCNIVKSWRSWLNARNILQRPKMLQQNFDHFQLGPKPSNMSQRVATGWPKVCNTLLATMLQDLRWNVACVWPGLKAASRTFCLFLNVVRRIVARTAVFWVLQMDVRCFPL